MREKKKIHIIIRIRCQALCHVVSLNVSTSSFFSSREKKLQNFILYESHMIIIETSLSLSLSLIEQNLSVTCKETWLGEGHESLCINEYIALLSTDHCQLFVFTNYNFDIKLVRD